MNGHTLNCECTVQKCTVIVRVCIYRTNGSAVENVKTKMTAERRYEYFL